MFGTQSPYVNLCHTCKHDNNSYHYNCLAYTLGITNEWIWLAVDIDHDLILSAVELDMFYIINSVPWGSIAYYGYEIDDIKHVAKLYGGNGPCCNGTSKFGEGPLASHDIMEVSGGMYGQYLRANTHSY